MVYIINIIWLKNKNLNFNKIYNNMELSNMKIKYIINLIHK